MCLNNKAWYKGESNEVTGEDIYFDKKTEKFVVSGRSRVSDPPSIIEADCLDYNKSIKYGKADGNVVWRDTSARTTIIADHVVYWGENNFMKASNDKGRPLFITEIDKDTLYMKADTLRSFRSIRERVIVPDKRTSRRGQKESDSKIMVLRIAASFGAVARSCQMSRVVRDGDGERWPSRALKTQFPVALVGPRVGVDPSFGLSS